PTNHLDIMSREWIESALDDFEGTMLFVSHDRYFLNRFANKIWSMDNGIITEFNCGYDEYTEILSRAAARPLAGKRSGDRQAAGWQAAGEQADDRQAAGKHVAGEQVTGKQVTGKQAASRRAESQTKKTASKNPVSKNKGHGGAEKPAQADRMIYEAEEELGRLGAEIDLALAASEYTKLSLLYEEKSKLEERIASLYNEWFEEDHT
ncbi:MAG: hypothetical protein FWH01_08610, partial [Oscillospiraceae bacterium]|nr:hypothetical protein [Oscillospiraceae bacterium]